MNVQEDSPVRKSAVTRKQDILEDSGENLLPVLHTLYTTDREFKTHLNDAMMAAFGKDFEELEFPPAEDQRVQMRIRWKSLKQARSAADLSDGTLRFLMIVAILASPTCGDLIAIDEPELHLHPSMFPIIAELASETARKTQVVFTTQSPEFLSALGTKLPITSVLQNVNGQTELNVLDETDMKKWLARYKLGELFVSGELEALT